MINSHPQAMEFHAFTTRYNGRTHRIITEVGVSSAFDPANPPAIPPVHYRTKALWDTGATGSVITQSTAVALGLTPVGNALVNHAGGTSPSATYLVNVMLPNNVSVAGVLVTECHDVAGDFGAIIGMDIIMSGDLSLSCVDGKSMMSFRIPSLGENDYVKEANRIQFAGVGRNDPCPCGEKHKDGKPMKFKHCHGK